MRKAYIRALAMIGVTAMTLSGLWSFGIAPALHMPGWQLGITDICAAWLSGVAGFKTFEPWLDKIRRAESYIREMEAIMQRDRERARA